MNVMTADQFRAALDQLDMTSAAFAARAGIHPTTLSRQLTAGRVPRWAAWIVTLLLERQEISRRLTEPL